MTDGIYQLAQLFRARDNPKPQGLTEGIVEELPELKIRINDKVVLFGGMIRSLVNLYEQDEEETYIWKGKRVYLLPFPEDATGGILKYLVLGGDAIGD